MSRPRDTQRARLYRAEKPSGGLHPRPEFDRAREVQAWVNRITRSRWWRGRFPRCGWINVKDGRGRRVACGTRYWNHGEVRLPRWSRSRLVILHEVAHCVQPRGTASHGPEFARLYLDLVRRWIGPEEAARLREGMRRERVRVAPRAQAYHQ